MVVLSDETASVISDVKRIIYIFYIVKRIEVSES